MFQGETEDRGISSIHSDFRLLSSVLNKNRGPASHHRQDLRFLCVSQFQKRKAHNRFWRGTYLVQRLRKMLHRNLSDDCHLLGLLNATRVKSVKIDPAFELTGIQKNLVGPWCLALVNHGSEFTANHVI